MTVPTRGVRAGADPRAHHARRQPARRWSAPTSGSRRRSRRSSSPSRAGPPTCPGSATGPSAPGMRARRAIQRPPPRRAARRDVRAHPGARRSSSPISSDGRRPSSRSTPRRCSTTSSALHYGHDTGGARVERWKWKANRACFARAAAVVTWAEWTKAGLVDRYEVPARQDHRHPARGELREVGGARRCRTLPTTATAPCASCSSAATWPARAAWCSSTPSANCVSEGVAIELDLVTRDDAGPEPGITVHHGLGPNSPALIELYHRADVFCLPTLGDCLPMVLSEAGAVGLPLVSTDVGAIGEIVRDGRTGLLVPVGDATALAAALRRLATEPGLRRPPRRRGARASSRSDYDAATNAQPAGRPARRRQRCGVDDEAGAADGLGDDRPGPPHGDRRWAPPPRRLPRDGRRLRRRPPRPCRGPPDHGRLRPLARPAGRRRTCCWPGPASVAATSTASCSPTASRSASRTPP